MCGPMGSCGASEVKLKEKDICRYCHRVKILDKYSLCDECSAPTLINIERTMAELREEYGDMPKEIRMKPEVYDEFRKHLVESNTRVCISPGVNTPTIFGVELIIDATIEKDWDLVYEKEDNSQEN